MNILDVGVTCNDTMVNINNKNKPPKRERMHLCIIDVKKTNSIYLALKKLHAQKKKMHTCMKFDLAYKFETARRILYGGISLRR